VAFVAAMFAVHPLHVESVAWISERKDVLSTLFCMLTMAAYLRYAKRPSVSWYLLSIAAFALGLMAKPMLVTLPFVLLLLDYWPLERFDTSLNLEASADKPDRRKILYRIIIERFLSFALAAVSSVITFIVQKAGGL